MCFVNDIRISDNPVGNFHLIIEDYFWCVILGQNKHWIGISLFTLIIKYYQGKYKGVRKPENKQRNARNDKD